MSEVQVFVTRKISEPMLGERWAEGGERREDRSTFRCHRPGAGCVHREGFDDVSGAHPLGSSFAGS